MCCCYISIYLCEKDSLSRDAFLISTLFDLNREWTNKRGNKILILKKRVQIDMIQQYKAASI